MARWKWRTSSFAGAMAPGNAGIGATTEFSMTAAQALYVGLGFVRAEHVDGLVPAASLMAYTLDLNGG